jgi:dTDP-4-amino-4,6-dideoxygalactose transaminase
MNHQVSHTYLGGDPEAVSVPFNDLSIQWREIAEDIRPHIEALFVRGTFSQGPDAEAFERDVGAYLDVPHAIGVNSGTSALHLAVVAAGIGPGDDVLVPSHTFIATIWAVIYAGANPILCDVDAKTATIDIKDAERRLTARTRAIIPVHLYGQPADMNAVAELARKHGLAVIEDAAQSIGARWDGRATGTLGSFGCYSFYPGKNLGAAGEAGLVVTHDDASAAQVRALRSHGQSKRYVHTAIGFNYRMDSIQGLVLRYKLAKIDQWTNRRREIAALYIDALSGLPLEMPTIAHQDHVWHLFVVRTRQRDALRNHLQQFRIESGLHYPIPNHNQPCLSHLNVDRRTFPQSDRWASEGLSLPLFYGMTDMQVERVSDAIRGFFKQSR